MQINHTYSITFVFKLGIIKMYHMFKFFYPAVLSVHVLCL